MTQDSNLAVISPFVLLPEVVKLTNQPRSTILKYTKTGQFVPMVRLLGNRIAFIRSDVLAWVESRVASAKEAGEIHRAGNYVLKGLPVGGVK